MGVSSTFLPPPPSSSAAASSALRECRSFLLWSTLACTLVVLLVFPTVHYRKRKPTMFVWPQNVSRDPRLHVRPGETTSLMRPDFLVHGGSQRTKQKLDLLVVVCSAVANFEERSAVRRTWAAPDLTPTGVRVAFLIGVHEGARAQSPAHPASNASAAAASTSALLQEEHAQHGDLIQEDFVDSYANLSVKSLMLLKVASKSGAPLVLKTDDDVYVNLASLKKEAASAASKKQDFLLGNLICGAKPIRDPYNKWYAPRYMYAQAQYPNYLSGTAYLMSGGACARLLRAALEDGAAPIFHLEDIYVTGVLAKRAGLRPRDSPAFTYLKRPPRNACLMSQAVSSHGLTAAEMETAAEGVRRTNGNCRRIPRNKLRGYGPGKCKW